MKHGKFVFGTVAAAVLAFAGTAQASNLVINGSFEDFEGLNEGPSSGNWKIYTNGQVSGWTIDAGTGNGLEIRNNAVGAAYDGSNFAELDANKNMSIWQTLTTVFNQAYQVSFAYSPRQNQPASTNPITVTWNGVEQLLSQTVTGNGASSGNAWAVYTFNIVADSTSSVLRFTADGDNDSVGGGIDAVSVVSAVPLPGAALMFGSALLGAGALRKRKAGKEAQAGALAA